MIPVAAGVIYFYRLSWDVVTIGSTFATITVLELCLEEEGEQVVCLAVDVWVLIVLDVFDTVLSIQSCDSG